MAHEKTAEKVRRPLEGLRVIDMSRLAPGPYCTMLLADLGAEVIAIGGGRAGNPISTFSRGKKFIKLDLKAEKGKEALQRLCETADVFIEGFRPGVSARLGASYEELKKINPRLVYCSITGYGQEGELSQEAGHDIGYLSYTGVLGAVGPSEGPPSAPLNLVADFAGGSFNAVMGILSALYERSQTGLGRYIDAAMIDGCLSMMAMHWPVWGSPVLPERGQGLLAGGAPYYRCYECKDKRYVAVGALEPHFFFNLWTALFGSDVPDNMDMRQWPKIQNAFEEKFKTKTRDEWVEFLEGKDTCVTPVLEPTEVWKHPHIAARHPDANKNSVPVIPRFDGASFDPPATNTEDQSHQILKEIGLSDEDIELASPVSERERVPSRTWPPKFKW